MLQGVQVFQECQYLTERLHIKVLAPGPTSGPTLMLDLWLTLRASGVVEKGYKIMYTHVVLYLQVRLGVNGCHHA